MENNTDVEEENSIIMICEELDKYDVIYDEVEDVDELKRLLKEAREIDGAYLLEVVNKLQSQGIEYKGIEDIRDLKELLRNHIGLGRPKKSPNYSHEWEQIFNTDDKTRTQLKEVYEEVKQLESTVLTGRALEGIKDEFKNFEHSLEDNIGQLKDNTCQIIVTGEISSGKTSIINLLLGEDALPVKLLCCTSTICKIRNGDKKAIVNFTDGRVEKFDDRTFGSIDKFIEEKEREEGSVESIDIYWPLPMLRECIIVDTPGIGESKTMTEKLLAYLPNAIAFIFVINSTNAGGLQKDRLLKIFETLQKSSKETGRVLIKPEDAIFLFNKWDGIKEKHRSEVLDKGKEVILDNIGRSDIKNIFTISASRERSRREVGLGFTDDFQKFMDTLGEFLPRSLSAKIERNYIWLHNFLKAVHHRSRQTLTESKKSSQEKREDRERSITKLKSLEKASDEVYSELEKDLQTKHESLVGELYQHLNEGETKKQMFNWIALPNFSGTKLLDFQILRKEAQAYILAKIEEEIGSWLAKQTATEDFLQKLKVELSNINMDIESATTLDGNPDSENQSTGEEFDITLSTIAKVAIGVLSPIWVPLSIGLLGVARGLSVLLLPVVIGLTVKKTVEMNKFEKNPAQFLDPWAEEALTLFTKDVLSDYIEKALKKSDFEELLKQIFENDIPERIKVQQRKVEDITSEAESEEELLKLHEPIEKKSRYLLGKLYVAYGEISGLVIKDIRWSREKGFLGEGCLGRVFNGKIANQKKGDYKDVAVKMTTVPTTAFISAIYEFETLRKQENLHGKNILQVHGIFFGADSSLGLVMELGEISLEKLMVKATKAGEICGNQANKHLKGSDINYNKMTCGIANGLKFLHGRDLVHRDLKMSNIIMIQDEPMISDVGFVASRSYSYYHAPELSQGGHVFYDKSADVYSFGVMLWEMWYGVVDPEQRGDFRTKIRDNIQLTFPLRKPSPELVELIQNCCQEDSTKRPQMQKIYVTLEENGRP